MKLISKLSVVTLSVITSVLLGAAEGQMPKASYENLSDPDLNSKLVALKFKINEQKAGPDEATEMFKKVFSGAMEGSVKINKLWFADGNTSMVVTDSPIPMRIFFKGQFLMDNQKLMDEVDKTIKFKVSNVDFGEEPILSTIRSPLTDSKYWIYLTFSNYGKVNDGDFVDNIKPGTIPY
jgi:hypothetical protein